jgi:DNA-binding NarL/FixJ family response regulator
LQQVLNNTPGIEVVVEASNLDELRLALRNTPCDVLILELNRGGRDGFEVLEYLQRNHETVRSLVLSGYASEVYALRCIRAGAWAFLNKGCTPSEVVNAVQQIGHGRKYVSAEVADLLLDGVQSGVRGPLHEGLSKRELQTLKLLAQGQRLTDIADTLLISVKTVSVYRRRILDKLKLQSNGELIGYAIYHRLI